MLGGEPASAGVLKATAATTKASARGFAIRRFYPSRGTLPPTTGFPSGLARVLVANVKVSTGALRPRTGVAPAATTSSTCEYSRAACTNDDDNNAAAPSSFVIPSSRAATFTTSPTIV